MPRLTGAERRMKALSGWTPTYSTHREGGLTEKDFAGARAADAVEKNV
jgi:hypothetical protein